MSKKRNEDVELLITLGALTVWSVFYYTRKAYRALAGLPPSEF